MKNKSESMILIAKSNGTLVIIGDRQRIFTSSEIADGREKYGGSFLKSLAVALRRADRINTKKLLSAFENYVREYFINSYEWGK